MTCCTDPALPTMSAVPAYVAVTFVLPTGSVDVLTLAFPFDNVSVPNVTDPAVKVTFPVGVTVGDFTVAVNFTVRPDFAGFTDDTTVVAVVAFATV